MSLTTKEMQAKTQDELVSYCDELQNRIKNQSHELQFANQKINSLEQGNYHFRSGFINLMEQMKICVEEGETDELMEMIEVQLKGAEPDSEED